MSRVTRTAFALAGALALLVWGAGPVFATPRPFHATDLGSLSTTVTESSARAINDRGVIVGTAYAPDGTLHGVLWRTNGSLRELGENLYPVDINNGDAIIGTLGRVQNPPGFIWQKGVIEYLEGPPPFKLNDRGQMLLRRSNPAPALPTYFFRDSDGQVTEFPQNVVLNDLNNLGQVVGTMRNPASKPDQRGFVWQAGAGTIRDFGPATEGILINDKGHVVKDEIVYCGDGGCRGDYQPYHYLVVDGQQTLIRSYEEFMPLAMNEKDQVVGGYSTLGGYLGAWFWARKAGFFFLQYKSSVWEIAARDINESRQIAGVSEFDLLPDPEAPGGFWPVARATVWTR